MSYGLFLNMGADLGTTHHDVVQVTLQEAARAESLGFDELWVTEHHFIPFGINPSALTAAAFLLGRTHQIRVGTAVTLAPLEHAVSIAEKAALLDQLSGGRFQLGLGRGGYLKDFEMLDIDPSCWDEEPMASAQTIEQCWSGNDLAAPGHNTGLSVLHPTPFSPTPPLYLATSSAKGISWAAQQGYPLQHYFATPAAARKKVEQAYCEAGGGQVEHVHTVMVAFGDTEENTRNELRKSLTRSFDNGNWPHVPQAGRRHTDEKGNPIERNQLAEYAAQTAFAGPPQSVRDQLAAFVEATEATRLVFNLEVIGDGNRTVAAVDTLCEQVLDDLGQLQCSA